ncbi:type II toxin-antitoxin system antitoxin DNA ADP-ribosyl glycohydrolase DarG [Pedobacter sp.]|uniref:type II toxin-antitoxin system antitoxin DNA ADP-ribosyl glycohydrolase DarG n=1 Tax=Pedobacter sp. TaxID=1411316 RepID=UPI003D7FB39F
MQYIKGNLLEAKTEALVNTVNTVGVMGKGIALQFKETFPGNYKQYLTACKQGTLMPGKLLVVKDHTLEGEKWIINFPTKTEWYKKSQYDYIERGLAELVNVIEKYNLKSIALPPLGCGNGGLNWDKVKLMIEKHLNPIENVDIVVFEPNERVKQILKEQESSKKIKLTPAKATLLYCMFYYDSLGENTSLFIANKLAYFLQRLGEPSLRSLKFEAHLYGPYTVQVDHMVQNMNGTFIKGLEQMQAKAFEPLELQYDRLQDVSDYVKKELSSTQRSIIKQLVKLIDGYQSALSLEILASIDLIKRDYPGITKEETKIKLKSWSARKSQLFQDRYIEIAWNHLDSYSQALAF